MSPLRVLACVLARAVVFLGTLGALLLILPLLALSVSTREEVTSTTHPAGAVITLVAVVTAYLLMTGLVERRPTPHELAPRRAGGLLGGLALGAALFALCWGAIALLGGHTLVRVDAVDVPGVAGLVLGAGVVAGVTEEILFRGVAFRLLEDALGTWAAVGVSALAFGLLHVANPDGTWWGGLAIALEAGLLFGVLFALTRSLWVLTGTHAAWNVLQGPVLGVPVSGNGEPPSLLDTRVSGPDWLTGGAFGTEGSVVTVVLLTALAAVLSVRLARGGGALAPAWSARRRGAASVAMGLPLPAGPPARTPAPQGAPAPWGRTPPGG